MVSHMDFSGKHRHYIHWKCILTYSCLICYYHWSKLSYYHQTFDFHLLLLLLLFSVAVVPLSTF